MTTIKVGGRELALDFTIEAMDRMETVLGESVDLGNLQKSVVDKTGDRKVLIGIIWAMAKPSDGQGEPVSREWLARNIHPGCLVKLRLAALNAMTEGMTMETEERDEDEEVDVVLEEIKKNDRTAE